MPRKSTRQELLDELDVVVLHVMEVRARNKLQLVQVESDIDDDDLYVDNEEDDMFEPIIISPPSPIPPLILLNVLDSESESDSQDSDSVYDRDKPYQRLLGEIMVLCDEAEQAQFLNRLEVPLLRTPQVYLLEHFAVFRPLLFHKKLHVEPAIFDCIIDKIHQNVIFHSGSNNLQLPVSIQLAIFLNHAGHYGNVISPEDVAQWTGVSIGSVVNCTHRVMIALLSCHNKYIVVPLVDSEDAELSHTFIEEWTFPGWQNGIFTTDGSTIPLFQKPGYYGETFYDRKSTYSLNCQAHTVHYHTSSHTEPPFDSLLSCCTIC